MSLPISSSVNGSQGAQIPNTPSPAPSSANVKITKQAEVLNSQAQQEASGPSLLERGWSMMSYLLGREAEEAEENDDSSAEQEMNNDGQSHSSHDPSADSAPHENDGAPAPCPEVLIEINPAPHPVTPACPEVSIRIAPSEDREEDGARVKGDREKAQQNADSAPQDHSDDGKAPAVKADANAGADGANVDSNPLLIKIEKKEKLEQQVGKVQEVANQQVGEAAKPNEKNEAAPLAYPISASSSASVYAQVPATPKKPAAKKTGATVSQVAVEANPASPEKKGWFYRAQSAILHLATNHYSMEDQAKDEVVNNQKIEMRRLFDDPQYVEFFELIRSLGIPAIVAKIDGTTTKYIDSNTLKNLIEVIFARGFTILARKAIEDKASNPGFDQQTSLVNVIAYLSKNVVNDFNLDILNDIEKDYRQHKIALNDHMKKYCVGMDSNDRNYIQALVKEYTQSSTNHKRINEIKSELFPDLPADPNQQPAETAEFIKTLESLRLKDTVLKDQFSLLTKKFIDCLFPNKLQDIPETSGKFTVVLRTLGVEDYIFNLIQSSLADLFKGMYEPMENDTVRNDIWTQDVVERVPGVDLQSLIEAPSSLLEAYAKNGVQSNPQIINWATYTLNNLVNPIEGDPEKDPALKKKQTLDQLSQKPLACWILKSAQGLLHSSDGNLSGIGAFLKQALNNLTLAVMSNGAKLAIGADDNIESQEFFKEMSERLINKINSLKGNEELPDQFWNDFMQDLPLSPQLKNALIPFLIDQFQKLRKTIKETAGLEDIQKLQANVQAKIASYEGGNQLQSIIENTSERMIKKIFDKIVPKSEEPAQPAQPANPAQPIDPAQANDPIEAENDGIIAKLGLEDSLEELFVKYFPNGAVDDELKNWFKENIEAFVTAKNGESPQAIALFKSSIETVLQKAMALTIDNNFKNSGKNYVMELLINFQGAFTKVFSKFDANTRAQIDAASKLKAEIDKKNDKIQLLRNNISKKPEAFKDISKEQLSLIQNVMNSHVRVVIAKKHFSSLKEQRTEILNKLNDGKAPDQQWSAGDLAHVNEALTLRMKEASSHASADLYLAALKNQVNDYNLQLILTDDQRADRTQRQILIKLLELSSEHIALITDLINTHEAIARAPEEMESIKNDFQKAKQAVDQLDPLQVANAPAWDEVKKWMNTALESKKKIFELSCEITDLEKQLDAQLEIFQTLSEELMKTVGLDKPESLNLPPFLLNKVWPRIQHAKKHQIARFLFKHTSPILISIIDLDKNKKIVDDDLFKNPIMSNLVHEASIQVMDRIPKYFTSYKPFVAQILGTIYGALPVPDGDITKMETSLKHTLIRLGKDELTHALAMPLVDGQIPEKRKEALALVKSFVEEQVPQDQAEELTKKLIALLEQSNNKEISTEEVLKILPKLEESNEEERAHVFATNINFFLFNQGRGKLQPKDLLEAYEKQVGGMQVAIPADQREAIQKKLQSEQIVEKIKAVAISPEEIAQTLNGFVPGAVDIHTLIAPQLQALLVNKDPAFNAHREFFQKCIEGILLSQLVKIGQAHMDPNAAQPAGPNQDPNQQESLLISLTKKLKELALKPQPGKSVQDTASEVIDLLLKEILCIDPKDALNTIPVALQKLIYGKVYAFVKKKAVVFEKMIIERDPNKLELNKKSGSTFLSNLSKALSNDLNGKLKITPESVSGVVNALAPHLDQPAREALTKDLVKYITEPKALANALGITQSYLEGVLLKVFIRIAEKNPAQGNKDTLIVVTEKLLAAVSAKLAEVRNIAESNPVEGDAEKLLATVSKKLKEMQKVADDNPKDEEVKKHLEIFTKKLDDAKKEGDVKKRKLLQTMMIELVILELNDYLMKELLCIDSPEALIGVPSPLNAQIYNLVKKTICGHLLSFQKSLATLENDDEKILAAKEKSKELDPSKEEDEGVEGVNEEKGLTHILAEDIANLVIASVPHVLAEQTDQNIRGVTIISKNVQGYLEDLAKKNFELASVLLDYSKTEQFKQIIGSHLTHLASSNLPSQDRKKGATLLANALVGPLNAMIKRVIDFEQQHQHEFNQSLMTKILQLGANHLKNLNAAKAVAEERNEVRYQDLLNAAEPGQLHKGLPKAEINFSKTLDAVAKRVYPAFTAADQKIWAKEKFDVLNLIKRLVEEENKGVKVIQVEDFIKYYALIHKKHTGKILTIAQRKALKFPDAQKVTLRMIMREEADTLNKPRKEAYAPVIKSIMKMIFPNGAQDLTFIQEPLREGTWALFEKNLFPLTMQIITELLFDPNTINSIILSGLNSLNESLEGEIELTQEPQNKKLEPLDQVAGELISEALKSMELPSWAKKYIVDASGNTKPEMALKLSASLKKQFSDTFMKEKLSTLLQKLVSRKDGKPFLSFDPSSREKKKVDASHRAVELKAQLKKAMHRTVKASVSNYLRSSSWAPKKMKGACYAVFRFIVLKCIGSIIAWFAYKKLKVDKNRENLLELLTKLPAYQPESDKTHVVYHENLAYNVLDAIIEEVNEFEPDPVPVPMPVADAKEQPKKSEAKEILKEQPA